MGDTADFAALDRLVEACAADELAIKTLRPSRWRFRVVRVSDMITYVGRIAPTRSFMGVIDSLDVFDNEVVGRNNARIINNLTVDLVNAGYGTDRIALSEGAFADLKRADRTTSSYRREGMVNGAGSIVEEMFEELYERLLEDLRRRRGLAGVQAPCRLPRRKSRTVEIDEVPGI